MKAFLGKSLLPLLAAAACAPRGTVEPATPAPRPAPASAPAAAATPSAAEPAAAAVTEPPDTWWLEDPETGTFPGIGLEHASELLKGRSPQRSVVVAIIDGGVDTTHEAIRDHLWSNDREVPANGKDDDGDGYVDDVRGWNFIGGADGKDVQYDTYEVTRQYVKCKAASAGTSSPGSAPADCAGIAQAFQDKRQESQQTLAAIDNIESAMSRALPILQAELGTDSLTPERVSAMHATRPDVKQAQAYYMRLVTNGLTPDAVADAKEHYENDMKYGLNESYDPRGIVGDDYSDAAERDYGNSDVVGPDAMHGTHVAGIVLRERQAIASGSGPDVRVMSVRTVPDGDERDKDVANAIRYAADHGANIINMSFGKPYSPQKPAVDAAVRYAVSKGVLFVHAAGNDAEDLASNTDYPSRVYASGDTAASWIEVGASSWQGPKSLAASFSNYGAQQVDVFAPGVDILSSVPGDAYKRESGTSMAAPVVTGLAAVLMAYFPDLKAADVKRILLESATRYGTQPVVRPGTKDETVPFGQLSRTGGIVNGYAAIRMALQRSTKTEP